MTPHALKNEEARAKAGLQSTSAATASTELLFLLKAFA
jgi:hypothetical protein